MNSRAPRRTTCKTCSTSSRGRPTAFRGSKKSPRDLLVSWVAPAHATPTKGRYRTRFTSTTKIRSSSNHPPRNETSEFILYYSLFFYFFNGINGPVEKYVAALQRPHPGWITQQDLPGLDHSTTQVSCWGCICNPKTQTLREVHDSAVTINIPQYAEACLTFLTYLKQKDQLDSFEQHQFKLFIDETYNVKDYISFNCQHDLSYEVIDRISIIHSW